jgi:hypothetical protein
LGSITDINPYMLPDFDMMVGGFSVPGFEHCQGRAEGIGWGAQRVILDYAINTAP